MSSPKSRNSTRARVTEISWSRCFGSNAGGVALLDRGVHPGHELRCALGLVLGLDVERAADSREQLVDVELRRRREAGWRRASQRTCGSVLPDLVDVTRGPGDDAGALGGARWPAPDLLVVVVEDHEPVGGGLGDGLVELRLTGRARERRDLPDADALVGRDVGRGELDAVVELDLDRAGGRARPS